MNKQELKKELINRLEKCNSAMEYAAFNYDGSKLKDLRETIIESTGVSDTLLIEVRNNNQLMKDLQTIEETEEKESEFLPNDYVKTTSTADIKHNKGVEDKCNCDKRDMGTTLDTNNIRYCLQCGLNIY
jgi:hypothetical protein